MNWFWPETDRGPRRDLPHPRSPDNRSARPAATPRAWRWARSAARILLVGWLVLGIIPRAAALDPRRSLTQYRRQTWGPEQGMPCNNVLSVIQGRDGYLWIGTEEGLVRFDGVRARIFDHHTDPALVNNSVYSVTEDLRRPGELLLGSAGGVCRYAGGKVSVFQSNDELAGFSGVILFQDPMNHSLWVRSSRGIFQVSPDGTMTDAADTLPPGKVRTVCRDERGRLWVGTADGLHRQNGDPAPSSSSAAGTPRSFEPVPGWAGKGVDYLCPARGGGVWVGSQDGGCGRLDDDGNFHPRPALAGCLVTRMLEDRAGMLWVGTNGSGLFRLPVREDAGVSTTVLALTTANGLAHNLVNNLCEDREGNLWIASQLGLQVLRDVRFVNFGRPEGLAGDDVRSIFEDARGRIWIGNENGLGTLDPTGERVTSYPVPLSPLRPGNSRVICVGQGDREDGIWAGTTAGLVSWREGTVELLPLREDLDRSAVRTLCRDAAGDLWIGTNTGLYQVRARRVEARFTAAEGLANDSVRALHADDRGNLWVATAGGLSRRGADGRFTNYLNFGPGRGDGTVLSFLPDPAGTGDLFVGTEFGLHRVHLGADGQAVIRTYSERDGLFDNILWGLVADDRGNLWMSCNKGVSRVARADLDRFDRREISQIPHVVYGIADGMRSRECNGGHQPAACRDHAGRLWFATVKGAAVVDPAHVEPDPVPPPVHVEEMTADAETLPGNIGASNKTPPELPPGTQKLGFRYTALSLVAPEANRFRYRLEGYDPDWTDAKTERTARYTNLPPGLYRFHVQAASADGAWTPDAASFSFRLRPFFYQTGWFRALVLVAGCGLLWGGQRMVRRRWQGRLARAEAELRERARTQEILRTAKEEAERGRQVARLAHAEAVTAREEAERANLAKSEFLSRMSHELRTPLNAILGFGQLLELEELPRRQAESVRLILGGGRHLLGLVDEILDLSSVESGAARVRSEVVETAPLLAEVLAMIEPLARERGVALHVEGDASAAPPFQADGQRLKQVLLNLLSNAVKYNRDTGGEVFVGLAAGNFPGADGSRQRLRVRDTGRGIDAEGLAKLFTPFERLKAAYGPIEGTGLGLVVAKQLVEAMDGTIGVESTPGQGSTFWVELPIAIPPRPGGAETPGTPSTASGSAAGTLPAGYFPAALRLGAET